MSLPVFKEKPPRTSCAATMLAGTMIVIVIVVATSFQNIGWPLITGLLLFLFWCFTRMRTYFRASHSKTQGLIIDQEGFHNAFESGDLVAWKNIHSIELMRDYGGIRADAGKVATYISLNGGTERSNEEVLSIQGVAWIKNYKVLVKVLEEHTTSQGIQFSCRYRWQGRTVDGVGPY